MTWELLKKTDLRMTATIRMTRLNQGMANRSTSLFRAGSTLPFVSIRQSVERTLLLTDAKAKLLAWKTHLIVLGTLTLVLPSMVRYCSHSVSACSKKERC